MSKKELINKIHQILGTSYYNVSYFSKRNNEYFSMKELEENDEIFSYVCTEFYIDKNSCYRANYFTGETELICLKNLYKHLKKQSN